MCDQCQYRTVNKQNFTNHLEDHKNGLLFEGEEEHGGSTRKRLAAARQAAKPKEQAYSLGPVASVDLSKVVGIEGLAPGDLNAAQLIYSALNAMSQQGQAGSQSAPEDSVQQASSVTSATHDGVTTHTITLHLPQLVGGAPTEVVAAPPHEGTSSAAVEIPHPVVLTVSPDAGGGGSGQQTLSLLAAAGGSEPAAAAGEVQSAGDSGQTQQMTDIVQQAIEGLEVLHQGDASHVQQIQDATNQAQLVQGLDVLHSNQVLQAVGNLQNYETVQILQPQVSNITVGGHTLQIQGQNIIASDTGQVLFKSDGDSRGTAPNVATTQS